MAKLQNHHKAVIGGILIAILLIILFFIHKKASSTSPVTKNPAGGVGPTNYTDVLDLDRQLKLGDKGNSVVALQKQFNKNASPTLVADGVFGAATEKEAEKQMSGSSSFAPGGTLSVNDVIAYTGSASTVPNSIFPSGVPNTWGL